MSDAMIAFRLWCPPGLFAYRSMMERVLRPFLGDDRFVADPPARLVAGVPGLEEGRWLDDRIGWLVADTERGLATTSLAGPQRTVSDKRGRAFISFRFSLSPRIDSAIVGRVERDRAGELIDVLTAACELLRSPFAYIGLAGEMEARERAHLLSKFEASRDGRLYPLGAADGLSGVYWRLVAGPPIVKMFGGDASLASLPMASHALPEVWVLSGAQNVEDWSGTTSYLQERELMLALGVHKFFDVDTGRLPSVHPEVQPARYPVAFAAPDGSFEIREEGNVVRREADFFFQ